MGKKKRILKKLPISIVLALICFTMVFPIYFMVISSLKNSTDYYTNLYGLPAQIYLSNYIKLFESYPILNMVFSSVVVTIGSLIFIVPISAMASYVFAFHPFRGSQRIHMGIVSTMMVPQIVLVIPVYLMMSKLRLINNYWSLILFYTAISIPFSIFLTTANFKSIPKECIESAQIDGASFSQIFFKIVLPIGMPAIMTVVTLNFLWNWNELLYAMLFLQGNEVRTLTVGVAAILGKRVTDTPLLMTGLFINTIPVLLLFTFANKYVIKGLTAGAVK